MSDDRPPKQSYSRFTDRPGPLMVMLWVAAAVMLLLVGLWATG